MKKITSVLIFLFLTSSVFSQQVYTVGSGKDMYHITVGPNAKKFFKSYEDYLANKPIIGVKLLELNPSSVKIIEDGGEYKFKASEPKYNWFCEQYGLLMRVFDGNIYYVLVEGPLTIYINRREGQATKSDENGFLLNGNVSDSYPRLYYSLTPKGEIAKFSDSLLEEYLVKHSLLNDYENDPEYKREMKDCVMCWQNKKTNKKLKYVTILNTKLK